MCHFCGAIHAFLERLLTCRTVDVFRRSCSQPYLRRKAGYCLVSSNWRRSTVAKIMIIAAATLALVTAAAAADLPRQQPVYQQAQVGKMPIGKSPIGKNPIGKSPVATRGY